jgi:excisionase family DNA binding protein
MYRRCAWPTTTKSVSASAANSEAKEIDEDAESSYHKHRHAQAAEEANVTDTQQDIAGGAATLPRLVSVEEAAALLSVADTTVRNWIKKDAIPYIVLPGSETRKQYRIPLQALLTSLAGNYDLASDLRRLDTAFGGEKNGEALGEIGRVLREQTASRARARGGEPVEIHGSVSDLFEHAQGSSE